MSSEFDELKSLFGGESQPGEGGGKRNFGPSNYYPFYDMTTGQRATVRFLPDKNKSNQRKFLVEQVFHNLTINGKKSKVPCLTQYGEECPICKVSQEYYKTEGKDSPNGKKYWRKKQYIGQILVTNDPLPANEEGETHAGKLRYITLGFQIYNIIKEAFAADGELECVPYDMKGGYDFHIKKTSQGEYASYTTGTKFANAQRALTDEELAVAEETMVDLSTLLPKNPGLDVIQAKLNADLTGEEYKDDRSSRAAAPKRVVNDDADDAPVVAAKPVAKPAAKPAPVANDDDEESSDVDEMLAQIRARRAGK